MATKKGRSATKKEPSTEKSKESSPKDDVSSAKNKERPRKRVPRKKQVTLRLKADCYEMLQELANDKMFSVQGLLEKMIEEDVEREKYRLRWLRPFPFLPEEQSVDEQEKLDQLFSDLQKAGFAEFTVGPFWYVEPDNVSFETERIVEPKLLDRKYDGLFLSRGMTEDYFSETGIPFVERPTPVKKFYGMDVDPRGGFFAPYLESTMKDCRVFRDLQLGKDCFLSFDRITVRKIEGLILQTMRRRGDVVAFALQRPGHLKDGPSLFEDSEQRGEDKVPFVEGMEELFDENVDLSDLEETHPFPDEPEDNEE